MNPAEVPRGTLIATFARTDCKDNDEPTVYVDYVQGVDGKTFVVERSSVDRWLLISNGRREGDVIVFQAIRESSELREYRFPIRVDQPGQYLWATDFKKPAGSRHRFETQVLGTPNHCRLLLADPLTGKTKTGPEHQGWGFDDKSFVVGDHVLVSVQGRTLPAEVLQAPGGKYFVRLEGVEGDGRWIEASEIVGRLIK